MAVSISDLDLHGVSDGIGRREISSVQATEAYLGRIAEHDSVLRSYITVTADMALAQAKEADGEIARGRRRGPLHGVPIALKDLIAVAGVKMTSGSRVLADHVPTRDAFITRRLKDAGAVLLGKLAMHEFAFGRPVTDGAFPTGRNPWDVRRAPAGSSSGSAVAAAAGLCAGALGSDTGGSIRGPAAMTGLVGHKPTYGLVSRSGVLPLSWSLDHVGPMTRGVWDSAVLLQTIAGADPDDTSTRGATTQDYVGRLEDGARGLRLGMLKRYYVDVPGLNDEVRGAALTAFDVLRKEGATIEDVDAPSLDLAMAVWAPIMSEAYEYHAATLRATPEKFGEGLRTRIYLTALFTAQDIQRAQRLRARIGREVDALLSRVDALIFPGQAAPALRFEEFPSTGFAPASIRYTAPWNLLGLPAVVVPSGFTREGLPVSIQIVGRRFDDATVLRIARAYERVTDWHRRRPDPTRWHV
jgi:aspartyl-tRNA(Asn)/glutamyl-tRNA(Gln) amidotransferase subunit A